MSEQQPVEPAATGRLVPTGTLLTPKAAAIAGFTFAVLSMMGQGTWSVALQSLFWGQQFAPSQVSAVVGSWSVATLLIAGLGWLLARRTLGEPTAAVSWEGHLARAGMIVAAVSAGLSVLGVVGALLHLGG
jgi:hypothetical protein